MGDDSNYDGAQSKMGSCGLAFNYREYVPFDQLDRKPGPKTEDYPRDCLVEECLIHDMGTTEKQVAEVQVAMAARITVRHVSIYDTPRAGINIGNGTWGGHQIEWCDVFDTVQMTGDHGSIERHCTIAALSAGKP